MIKYAVYTDKVLAEYQEGVRWDYTVSAYLKTHTRLPHSLIDFATNQVFHDCLAHGVNFRGKADYVMFDASDVVHAKQLAKQDLKTKYYRFMSDVVDIIVSELESDIKSLPCSKEFTIFKRYF